LRCFVRSVNAYLLFLFNIFNSSCVLPPVFTASFLNPDPPLSPLVSHLLKSFLKSILVPSDIVLLYKMVLTTTQWRNYNFWAHPGKHSLPANSLDTQIGSLWAPFNVLGPCPRHCRGCRWLVTPLPPPVNLLSYYCLLIICLITRYSI